MPVCRSCHSETSRLVVHFESPDGQPLAEPRDECPQCSSLAPVRPKLELTPNWIANPEQYDTLEYIEDGERVPIVKDWAKGEFEQLILDAPVATSELEQVKAAKRAFAREVNHFPMTKEEGEKIRDRYREQFEMIDRVVSARNAGIILP